MEHIFFQITIVIFLSAIFCIIFRFFKQPSILAFIITGILVGPLGPFHFDSHELMNSLASIGITLLLFMIGLELKLSELKSLGKNILIAGVGQIVFTSIAGFGISMLLGFEPITSIYIGIALSLSSTIMIIKLLGDKRDLKSLYGKITVGILLVQDLAAILILIVLSTMLGTAGSSISVLDLALVVLKVVVLFGWVIVLSKFVLPKLLNIIARSPESLFLFSLAWAFGVAALVSSPFIGFSIEIGGLLAGLSLAGSVESFQISTRVKPLRDFFLTIFFVTLGMELVFDNMSEILIPVIVLSLFVLFITPIIVMIILGLLKYKKRTSFMSGVALAQVSEFSLLMIFMGNKIGHLSSEVVSAATLIGVITFVVSTYFITYSTSLYKFFMPYLGIFERRKTHTEEADEALENHTILVGANRMGEGILEALVSKKENLIVVDFDPEIIEKLNRKKVRTLFGDITDPEIAELAYIEKARLIIMTVTDPEDTTIVLKQIKRMKKKPKVIAAAFEKVDAKEFYKLGADYVIMPHIAGGNHLAKILVEGNELELIEKYRIKEKDYIS